MDFQTSLNVYNRTIIKSIAARQMSFELLETLYESMETIFSKEVKTLLDEKGVTRRVTSYQDFLSDHWDTVVDYSLDPKANVIRVLMNNGDVIEAKLGSLRSIVKQVFEMSERDPAFFLVMGYLHASCLESVCLAKAIENRMDMEI